MLLGFGNCGNAIQGLKSGDFELIVPRLDDCVSLVLGSQRYRERYSREHHAFYLTDGWITGSRTIEVEYNEMIEDYGEEEADYDLLQRYLDTFGGGPNAGQSLNTGNPGNSDYTDDSGSDYSEPSYSDDGSSEEEYYSAPASDGGDDSGGGYTEPATEPAPAPEPEPVEENTTTPEGDGGGQ